jgi:tetratricopeptide (TPR) repeat protein
VSAPSSSGEPQNPPPALELSRVCNNLGNLLRTKGKPEEAAKFFERAIGIHRELVKKDPSKREYKQELAQFYLNLALLELDEDQVELAERQNHDALDLIEELASPGPSLSMKRAKAHMIRGWILESQSKQLPQAQSETEESQRILETLKRINAREHPEFHNMYMNFALNYASLAAKYLQSGELVNAQHALDSLARVMPELSPEDRAKFTGKFHELQKQLRDAQARQIRR